MFFKTVIAELFYQNQPVYFCLNLWSQLKLNYQIKPVVYFFRGYGRTQFLHWERINSFYDLASDRIGRSEVIDVCSRSHGVL